MLLFCAAVGLLLACSKSVDFDDNPALILDVSDSGIVSLDTYQGPVKGRLSGVRWRSDAEYLRRARTLIDFARRDKVAFALTRQGEIEIWYQTESGAESLNQQLRKIP